MNIRQAKEEDYIPIIYLYGLFLDNPKRFSNYDNDSFSQVIHNPKNYVYVAEDQEKIIGFASFSKRQVIRYPKPIVELDELFVLEDYRNTGVGKMLMKALEEKAKELGCCRVFIESRLDQDNAHHFYENLQFTKLGYFFIKNI